MNDMDSCETDFDEWFETLIMLLSDEGISFSDRAAVREDYDKGRDVFDVCDEIRVEYE